MSAQFVSVQVRMFMVEIKINREIPARATFDAGAAIRLTTADLLANVEHSILPTELTAKEAGQQATEFIILLVCGVTFEFEFHVVPLLAASYLGISGQDIPSELGLIDNCSNGLV